MPCVSGLDPARPLFTFAWPNDRLDASDAKVVQIIEGTNQIQRNIIANAVLGRESRH